MSCIAQLHPGAIYCGERLVFTREQVPTIAIPGAWMFRLAGAGDASGLKFLPGDGDATSWQGTELSEVSCL